MAPQATQTVDESASLEADWNLSRLFSSPPPATTDMSDLTSSTSTPTSTPTSVVVPTPQTVQDEESHHSWSNYLYLIVIISIVFLLLGFLYRRKRRHNSIYAASSASIYPHRRPFQVFHTHHPSQSRDLAAVQANNRVWRNMRAGPFSHHARGDSASMRAPRPSSSSVGASRSRVDVDDEVPPPYVPAEPERTLDRGPSTRASRNLVAGRGRGGGGDVNLRDLEPGRDYGDAGSMSKPPGYEER